MEHHKVILGGNGLRKRFFARNEMVRSEGRRRKIFSKREDSKNGGGGRGRGHFLGTGRNNALPPMHGN